MSNIQPSDVAQFAGNYYSSVRNPKWNDAEHTSIACEVNFSHVAFEEWTPFCVNPQDYMPYSRLLFDEITIGNWGDVAEFVPPVEPEVVIATEPQPEAIGTQSL
jgi:hypothetical protein